MRGAPNPAWNVSAVPGAHDLVVDYAKRRAFVSSEDARLTPMEYRIVNCSVATGKVLTHDMLLAYLWGPNAGTINRLLREHGQHPPQAGKDPAHPQYVQRRAWAACGAGE